MDAFDAIARRASVRRYRPDPLPRHVIERLIAAAVRAPNHKLTEPWRFVVVTGAARDRFAQLRRDHRARKFDDQQSPEAQKAMEKTYREHLETPAFVFVLCAVSDDAVRHEEDYGATLMAIQNLLVAAAADGIGSFLRTGSIMGHQEVRALVGAPDGFRIVGIVSLGYLAATPEPTPRKTPLGSLLRWLD
jgi:nitroreductase